MTVLAAAAPAAPASSISPALHTRVRFLLRLHDIEFGRLDEGPPALNLNLTDGLRVFVKVSRADATGGRAWNEVVGALAAPAAGVPAPEPLVPGALEVRDEDGTPRAVTVWRHLRAGERPGLVERVTRVTEILVALAAAPAPEGTARFDLAAFTDRVENRLAGDGSPTANLLRERLRDLHPRIASGLDPAAWRWIHGDLHQENLLWCSGASGQRPVVVDWESHAVGPVEWDVAQALRDIARTGASREERAGATRVLRTGVQAGLAGLGVCVDWALAADMAAYRTVSHASHLYVHGHRPDLLADLLDMLADDRAA